MSRGKLRNSTSQCTLFEGLLCAGILLEIEQSVPPGQLLSSEPCFLSDVYSSLEKEFVIEWAEGVASSVVWR